MAGWAESALDALGLVAEAEQPSSAMTGNQGFSAPPSQLFSANQSLPTASKFLDSGGMGGGFGSASALLGSMGGGFGSASSLLGGISPASSASSLIESHGGWSAGGDPMTGVGAAAAGGSAGGAGSAAGGGFGGGFGGVSVAGGNWAALDAHNNEIANAAAKTGAPPNLLKAMINRESSGNWARDGNRPVYIPGREGSGQILPFVGIFELSAKSHGLDWNGMVNNKQAQIDGMATILTNLANQYGGYENAAKVYFGGEAALAGGFTDEFGMDSGTYYGKAMNDWKYLDSLAGTSGQTWGDGAVGNDIVNISKQYLDVPYGWGSIPGKGDTPTSWDCSGMTYWLDQNYGDGSLPMGSHYQYQYAQQKGKLFQDTSQLQAGDMVFFDTGLRGGAGANLNGASHVGMYIGNGQMIHAANEQVGTIVSDISDPYYANIFLGAMHMSFSGGGGGYQGGGGGGGGGSSAPAFTSVDDYRLARIMGMA